MIDKRAIATITPIIFFITLLFSCYYSAFMLFVKNRGRMSPDHSAFGSIEARIQLLTEQTMLSQEQSRFILRRFPIGKTPN